MRLEVFRDWRTPPGKKARTWPAIPMVRPDSTGRTEHKVLDALPSPDATPTSRTATWRRDERSLPPFEEKEPSLERKGKERKPHDHRIMRPWRLAVGRSKNSSGKRL